MINLIAVVKLGRNFVSSQKSSSTIREGNPPLSLRVPCVRSWLTLLFSLKGKMSLLETEELKFSLEIFTPLVRFCAHVLTLLRVEKR